jgi:hypothetical protein
MFLAWGASDWIFGNQQVATNEALRQEFLNQPPLLEEDANILLYCVVRRTSGFTHCLSSVKVGDVVEVLQEGVGPDQAYNLCRLPAHSNHDMATDTCGWFPIRWLQRLDDYENMIEQQQQQTSEEETK